MRRGALGCALGIAVILIIVPPASIGQYWYYCPDSKAYYHAAGPDWVAAGCAVTTGPGPGCEEYGQLGAPEQSLPRATSDSTAKI